MEFSCLQKDTIINVLKERRKKCETGTIHLFIQRCEYCDIKTIQPIILVHFNLMKTICSWVFCLVRFGLVVLSEICAMNEVSQLTLFLI